METTTVQITSTWTQQIAVGDTEWILQNRGVMDIFAFYKATIPAVGDSGILLKKGEGLASAIHGLGDIWVRTHELTGTISLTK